MDKSSNRKISLDILRILAMLGIIGLHLIGQGGILENLNMHSIRTYIILLIYAICFLSVDTFAILSGYLSWKKEKVKYKRIVELIIISLFYSIVITIVFYGFNLYNCRALGRRALFHSLFPALIGRYWYITCYIFLFLLIPYLNFFINKISKEKLKKMLILIFILLCIIPNIFFSIDFFKTINGYSPFWLIYCYLLGAYVGKYLEKKKISKKMILSLIACIVSAFILNSLVRIITMKLYGELQYDLWFLNYVSPFMVISSIIVVMICSKIEISINNKIINKIISYLSLCSFSVYIIHSHYLIYDYYLRGIMVKYVYENILILIVSLFVGIILVYLICFIIDLIRIIIFKLLRIDNFIDKIGLKLNKLLD